MLLRDCVLRVLFLLLDPYAMQLMLLFQVHEKFLPVFFFSCLVSFAQNLYIIILYLEIFVGKRTYRCVALPVLNRWICVCMCVCVCPDVSL